MKKRRPPLLLGLDNPHSKDPRDALLHRPRGSTGHRLFELSRMSLEDYYSKFDRANVCDLMTTRDDAIIRGRTVLVLGTETWKRLELGTPPVLFKNKHDFWIDSTFILLPHPSGLNRFYNDPANCRKVTRVLQKEAKRT